jgi:hypothetical protein
MLLQWFTFTQVGATICVHDTVITRAGVRYRLHRIPASRRSEKGQNTGSGSVFGRSGTSCKVFDSNPFRNDLYFAVGVRVSTQRVHRRLYERTLRLIRPCIRIHRRHRQARLEWTMYTQWTMQQFRHVLFSYESKFCHHFTESRAREDEVNSYRLQILLSIAVTELSQLWFGEATAGMDEPTGCAKYSRIDRSAIHRRHLRRQPGMILT